MDGNLIDSRELDFVDGEIEKIEDAEEDLSYPALSDSDAIDVVAGDLDNDDTGESAL